MARQERFEIPCRECGKPLIFIRTRAGKNMPCVARAQVRKFEDSLLIESAPDEYFKKGLRESLMRAIEDVYKRQRLNGKA